MNGYIYAMIEALLSGLTAYIWADTHSPSSLGVSVCAGLMSIIIAVQSDR